MKAIITYYNNEDRNEVLGGVYDNITYEQAVEEAGGKHNLIDYIPLALSGVTYDDRKDILRNRAIEWSYASGLYEWSFYELVIVQEFFESYGRKYGLLREFHENGIC